jgi:hypothetical protein
LHEGQADGRLVRVPVTLGRRPDEPVDQESRQWYGRLLAALGGGLRRGDWSLATVEGWPDNRACERMAAWRWTAPDRSHLVVVNFGDAPADGRVVLPDVPTGSVTFDDPLRGERYERDGAAVASEGLYVALGPRESHLLRWSNERGQPRP